MDDVCGAAGEDPGNETELSEFSQDVIAQILPGLNPLPTAFECEFMHHFW